MSITQVRSSRANGHLNGHLQERVSQRASELRDDAMEAFDRLAAEAGRTANQGADWLRDRGDNVLRQVAKVSRSTRGYVREEPIRAVLIAAAAGAAVVLVASLFRRNTPRIER